MAAQQPALWLHDSRLYGCATGFCARTYQTAPRSTFDATCCAFSERTLAHTRKHRSSTMGNCSITGNSAKAKHAVLDAQLDAQEHDQNLQWDGTGSEGQELLLALPLGRCTHCAQDQISAGSGGFWRRTSERDEWNCFDCISDKGIRSYPTACEWCNYSQVTWHQGHTYACPRCAQHQIGQWKVLRTI